MFLSLYYFMKLKNKDLAEILTSINTLGQEKIPIRVAWKLETIRKAVLPFFETLQLTLDTYKKEKAIRNNEGEFVLAKDPQGNELPNTMVFDKKDIEELNKGISALMNEEIEIANLSLTIEDFPDNLMVSMNSVRGLEKIMSESV